MYLSFFSSCSLNRTNVCDCFSLLLFSVHWTPDATFVYALFFAGVSLVTCTDYINASTCLSSWNLHSIISGIKKPLSGRSTLFLYYFLIKSCLCLFLQLCKLLAFHTPNELQRRCGAWIKVFCYYLFYYIVNLFSFFNNKANNIQVDPYESPPAGYEMMQRLVIFGTCEQIYKTMVIINEAVVVSLAI